MVKLTVAQAAPQTGFSKFTLRAYARARRIPHYRVGKRILFDADELRDWMARRRIEADDAAPR